MLEVIICNKPYLIDIKEIIFIETCYFGVSLNIVFKNGQRVTIKINDEDDISKAIINDDLNDIKKAYNKIKEELIKWNME